MGFRVQLREVEIPEDDPFKNDLLGRKKPAEVLTQMLRSIKGPCVLTVDAPWGAGKTTFLNMLAQQLRNDEFPVVTFNAWETDFIGDPFLALSEELTAGLREFKDGQLGAEIDKVKNAGREVVRRAVPGVVRLLTAGILDVGPLMEKEVGQALASYAKQRLSEYLDARTSLRTFRASLEELAADLAQSTERPLIVVIDELDRCRPSYAVELLENAKHLFSADHIAVVLAVNREELAHSICTLYGAEFDAAGYLRRFFDLDFRLPEAKREPFMEETLKAVGIEDDTVRDWLLAFLGAPNLGLRTVAQSIHRLGLVFSSLQKGNYWHTLAATVALVMRTLDADRYRAFRQGEIEDREAIEFLRIHARELTGRRSQLLEAVVIVAAMEIRNPNAYLELAEQSSLLKGYQTRVDAAETRALESRSLQEINDIGDETAHARAIVNDVRRICGIEPLSMAVGFTEAVQRIELLSPLLLGDDGESSDSIPGIDPPRA